MSSLEQRVDRMQSQVRRYQLATVVLGLADVIGSKTGKDYVVRPWTEEENADFERFCASIDETPSDPDMEQGPVEFLSHDPWYDVELPRA